MIHSSEISVIEKEFALAKKRREGILITYICAGYLNAEITMEILFAMQESGANIIELGAPCQDPFADGPTLQKSHRIARMNGTKGIRDTLLIVKTARSKGLTVPIILMAYYSSIVEEYDDNIEYMCREIMESRINGILAIGITEGDQELELNKYANKYHLSTVHLVFPGSTDERLDFVFRMKSSFVYVVSVKGKTGARNVLPDDLAENIARIRSKTNLPLVVGFGISNSKMVHVISKISDGVVVGSFLTDCLNEEKEKLSCRDVIHKHVSILRKGTKRL